MSAARQNLREPALGLSLLFGVVVGSGEDGKGGWYAGGASYSGVGGRSTETETKDRLDEGELGCWAVIIIAATGRRLGGLEVVVGTGN